MAAQTASSQAPKLPFTIGKRRVGNVLVVTIAGRLTEAFDGKSLDPDLSGHVVFDLQRATGITSFAVRTWVDLLTRARPRLTGLWFVRCSQTMARQFAMIRNFTAGGHLASFYAPYLCPHCDNQYDRLFDCHRDAEILRRFQAPAAKCPRCGREGELDDEPSSCFAFPVQQPLRALPPEVVHALVTDDSDVPTGAAAVPRVEKAVEGALTRIRVNSRLDGSIRWDRILDGVEGPVLFDLTNVPEAVALGVSNFEEALRSLPSEIVAASVLGCPFPIVERMSTHPRIPRVTVRSAVLAAHCLTCSAPRFVVTDVETAMDALRGDSRVPCDRCGSALSLVRSSKIIKYLAAQPGLATPLEGTAEAPRAAAAPARMSTPTALLVLAGVIVLCATGVILTRPWAGPVQVPHPPVETGTAVPVGAHHPAAVQPTHAATDDLPPAWVEQRRVLDGSDLLVVGHGGPAATEAEAVEAARRDAIVVLSERVLQDLSGTPLYDYVRTCCDDPQTSPDVRARIAARWVEQVGDVGTPERVAAIVRPSNAGVEVSARYRLTGAALARAVEAFRYEPAFRGMTVARAFPLIERALQPASAAIVVGVRARSPAAIAGVQVGDVVVGVNGRRVFTAQDFATMTAGEWRKTPPMRRMALTVQRAGGEVTTPFVKPEPPPPRVP